MVKLLTHGADMGAISSEVVLCTCYTRNEGVTWAVLDALRCEILSKDSVGNCDFLFHDLHILDDENAVMTWPDGSQTDPKDTAFKILTEGGRVDVLVHPAMRGLLHWKFQAFGSRLMVAEVVVFFSWLIGLSLVIVMLPTPQGAGEIINGTATGLTAVPCVRFRDYTDPSDLTRGVLELLTLLLQSALFVLHLLDAVDERRTHGVQMTFWRWKDQRKKIRLPTLGSLAFLLPHLAVLGAVALRVASPTRGRCAWEIGLLTSANFVGWCLLVNLLMLQKTVGPFFIMCVFKPTFYLLPDRHDHVVKECAWVCRQGGAHDRSGFRALHGHSSLHPPRLRHRLLDDLHLPRRAVRDG